RLLRERKPDRRLDTNVEFFTALLLHGLGLPTELFTPTFAVGRVAGWAAHCLEQLREGKLIRPQSIYEGPKVLRYGLQPSAFKLPKACGGRRSRMTPAARSPAAASCR